jgi:hypothetical protein
MELSLVQNAEDEKPVRDPLSPPVWSRLGNAIAPPGEREWGK